MTIHLSEQKLGIPWCINCVGYHPDRIPNLTDFARKLTNPNKDVIAQLKKFSNPVVKALYKNKSCMICGRTYMEDGELDLTWKLTARRVKEEFQNAGIFGVDDKKIELVVARCRKSYLYLLEHRMVMPIDKWERFSFSGCLALILVNAGEARKSKHGLSPDNIKGTIKPSAT